MTESGFVFKSGTISRPRKLEKAILAKKMSLWRIFLFRRKKLFHVQFSWQLTRNLYSLRN